MYSPYRTSLLAPSDSDCRAQYRSPSTQLRRSLRWLPIDATITSLWCNLDTRSPASTPADPFFVNSRRLHYNSVTAFGRHRRSRHTENEDKTCISGFQSSPKIWTNLPLTVRLSDSVNSFWRLRKSHLSDVAYSWPTPGFNRRLQYIGEDCIAVDGKLHYSTI